MNNPSGKRAGLKHFYFLLSHWKLLIISILTGLTASFLEGLGIIFILPILEGAQISVNSSIPFPFDRIAGLFEGMDLIRRLRIIAGVIVIVTLLKGGAGYINTVASTWLRAVTLKHFRVLCFKQLMQVGMEYFNSQKGADFQTICNVYPLNLSSLVHMISTSIPNISKIIVLITMLTILSWKMTLLSILLALLVSFSMKIITKRALLSGRAYNEAFKAINSRLLENIVGMKTIRLFSREEDIVSLWERENDRYNVAHLGMVKVKGIVGPVFELLAVVCLAIMMVVGSIFLFESDNGGLATFIMFMVVFNHIVPPIQMLNQYRVDISGDIPSYRELFGFLDSHGKECLKNGRKSFETLKEEIRFCDATFRYKSRDSVVLDRISFSIPKGCKVGIVGGSGAGKSTLTELLLRFYDLQQGKILVDSVDLRDLDVNSWRSHIGVVSQDTFLLNDTIRTNIAFGRLDATLEDIESAAYKAYAHEFIEQLPQGYDTLIGDRGVLLSGGQRQRIAIARAIITEPDILILDEATSSLDSESERTVQLALDDVGKGRTVICIAHRLSTVFDADIILVMDQGHIVQQGSHKQLAQMDGVYKDLLYAQGYEGDTAPLRNR